MPESMSKYYIITYPHSGFYFRYRDDRLCSWSGTGWSWTGFETLEDFLRRDGVHVDVQVREVDEATMFLFLFSGQTCSILEAVPA